MTKCPDHCDRKPALFAKCLSYHSSTEVAERSSRKLAKNRGIQSSELVVLSEVAGSIALPAFSSFAQQRDRVSYPAPAGFETEWFYRFVTDVRDCFIDRIGRVDQF